MNLGGKATDFTVTGQEIIEVGKGILYCPKW